MIRFASLVFALLLGLASAEAGEAPVCAGSDLVAGLKVSDPAKYAEVMKEADATPNGNAVFWKIERQGLRPSWLLGTAHVTDPRVTSLPRGAEAALANASTLALELAELRDPKELIRATLLNATLLVLPPGQSLWDLIPDAEEPAIRDNVNLPAGAADGLFGYQPWVVATMLSIPLCEKLRQQQGLQTLDGAIAGEAGHDRIPLVGLETVKEQLSVFADMPRGLQVKYLIAVAKLGAKAVDYFETLIALYQQRKVAAYMPFARATEAMGVDEKAMMAFVEEDMIRHRNHRMAERAAALLAKGNAFIAVGALHLPGEQGLVALIRQAGYRVSPVN